MAMKSTEEKAIVKDMQLASLEVLRKTARDVFEENIIASELSRNVMDNMDDDINGDVNDETSNKIPGENGHSNFGLLKIDERDLVFGRVLGRGAFCVVRECSHTPFSSTDSKSEDLSRSNSSIKKITNRLGDFGRHIKGRRKRKKGSNESTVVNSTSSVGSNNPESRNRAERRMSASINRTRYVVKQLSPELKRSDKINFLKGTVDLAMETRFLTLLDHENIVCITGVSSTGAFSDGYFIVLEKLNETLGKRIKIWMDMDRQCKGITGVFTGSKNKARRLQSERFLAARSLVAGMDFLHQRNIVFRDLVSILFC